MPIAASTPIVPQKIEAGHGQQGCGDLLMDCGINCCHVRTVPEALFPLFRKNTV